MDRPTMTNGQVPQAIEKPWVGEQDDRCEDSSITTFNYRLKASEASEFLENLHDEDMKRLKANEQRIDNTRARLSRDTAKNKFLSDLKEAFERWREHPEKKKDPNKMFRHSLRDRGKGHTGNHLKDRLCPDNDANKRINEDENPSRDLKASIMFFEKSEYGWKGITYDKGPFSEYGVFPGQKLTLHDALHEEPNPFAPTSDDKGTHHLKYIHLPANHMGWVEQAMARVYLEENIEPKERTKTNQTLSREYWRGQLHGSGLGSQSACKEQMTTLELNSGTTTSTRSQVKGNERNFAIFLPYLHWETSSRRACMAKTIQEVWREDKASTAAMTVIKDKDSITEALKAQFRKRLQKERALKKNAIRGFEAAKTSKFKTKRRTPLGEYLMALAKLWEAMDTEVENRLLKSGLTTGIDSEPPLHIRRTLDQAYFPNLKDTSERDRDQVVYRATRKPFRPRVVMVDQLWLWILDELFIIIDQCSRVFFDRTTSLDLRPEVMDIFAETLGVVNDYKTIAYETFWRNIGMLSTSQEKRRSPQPNPKGLDINPEGKLLREAQDKAEELRMMIGIYAQQLSVVKDFHKCLEKLNGHPKVDRETKRLIQHLKALQPHQVDPKKLVISPKELEYLDEMIEDIENRKTEIEDLEQAALRTCQQLQELLALKQQQASIVEAKAALDRANEWVEQGKAIMAFTIMTIVFTPLGFFTSFFGMNNSTTGADWMSLGHQICCSTVIIVLVLLLAFKKKLRQPIKTLGQQWEKRMYLRMEAKYVEQEMEKTLRDGLRPSAATAASLGHLRPEERIKRSHSETFITRILARITRSEDSSYVEDVESTVYLGK
ncbi:hypothetical protein VP1G_07029 [Cytospora mali]|uniref:Ankyrin repeat protein n=1 Tax=Cytospora mali TaxID=578113 RepID=A0A194V7F3_CYTMA|nr:hypothetical protein VP1G_07029 [Valsa mali var. pyri (nom. inval.)]